MGSDARKMYRPQVLLLGNGAVMGRDGLNWYGFLDSISERPEEKAKELQMPMPLRAIYLTNDTIDAKLKENRGKFFGQLRDPEIRERLLRLLRLGFDEILTTNYSYELELAALGVETVTEGSLRRMSRSINPGERAEARYLLSTCNVISAEGAQHRIWHIHGEARKPDSMILGHYYYGSLLKQMLTYMDSRGKDYRALRKGGAFTARSWLDAFVLGDVYILGQGMGFSEIDLWWLLNRKKREPANRGRVWYYVSRIENSEGRDLQSRREKEELMRLLHVEVVEVETPTNTWSEFYAGAVEKIAAAVKARRSPTPVE